MTGRCLWCNGGGDVVELPIAGDVDGRRVPVHTHHEAQLRTFMLASERYARRLMMVLAATLLLAVPALAIATAFGAAARAGAAGVIILLIGAAAWRYPVATPPMMRVIGARRARAVTRVIAALSMSIGVLLLAAALGV